MNVYVVHGPTPSAILERYTLLTGRPALPPPWTFGLWLTTSFTTNYGEETVNGFLKGMEERDIPVEVFHYDCFWMKGFQWCDFEFDVEFFPDAKSQLARMRENGYKVSHLCLGENASAGVANSSLAHRFAFGLIRTSLKKVRSLMKAWKWVTLSRNTMGACGNSTSGYVFPRKLFD